MRVTYQSEGLHRCCRRHSYPWKCCRDKRGWRGHCGCEGCLPHTPCVDLLRSPRARMMVGHRREASGTIFMISYVCRLLICACFCLNRYVISGIFIFQFSFTNLVRIGFQLIPIVGKIFSNSISFEWFVDH